ncbi:MAG: HlyC/CorC family transporter [Ruminococcaceae bacterium]|nr:HlyC/CorC family transporter [Oscillospiraceae bacterium]
MASDSWILIFALLLFLLGASYCAATEISYSSINKIKLKNQADNNDKKALTATYILKNFDSALVALLIGNNLTHNGFAAVATILSTRHFGNKYLTLTTLMSTLIVFLFSEMIPKSFGKSNYNYALKVAFSLRTLMKILKPFSLFFMGISTLVSKFFPPSDEPEINEEEFFQIVQNVGEEGVISKRDHKLISSALNFDNKKAKDVYTPIEDGILIDISTGKKEIINTIKNTGFSRYPVFEGEKDNIVGVLQTKEFYKNYFQNPDFNLHSILLKPYFAGPEMVIDDLMNELSANKIHMSMVVDDNGNHLGIVTLNDILEELIGEIKENKNDDSEEKEESK